MPRTIPTHERLDGALKARGWSRSEFARRLHIDPSAVSRWVSGKSSPDAHHRVVIERVFGIPQNEWLTADERELIERVANEAERPTGTG
jgi:transcriptional regulator with XRE-family HTH domain